MNYALFSGFTLPRSNASGTAERPDLASGPALLSPSTSREAVARTLTAMFFDALPDDASLGRSGEDLQTILAAVADAVAGRSVILQLNADLTEDRRDAVRTFLDNVVRVSGTLEASRQEDAIAKLAAVILPDDLAPARGVLAADNLALRDRFVAQVSTLTSTDVANQAGHRSRNPYATAARWKNAGEIFSVHHRGAEHFPAFQFREGRPHPVMRTALAALPPRMSSWQRAFWFVSTNGWLDDAAPADVLDDVDRVVAAAGRESQEVGG